MTDDDLDVMVRSTARPVVGLAPSELDPGLLAAVLATGRDRAVPLRSRGGGPARWTWTLLASAAVVLLVLTVAAMPGGWGERLLAPAGGTVQRYLLPAPWVVREFPPVFDVDRLDTGVTGQTGFTDGDDGFADLQWRSAGRQEALRELAVGLTGVVDSREVTVRGLPHELFVYDIPAPSGDTRPGEVNGGAGLALWVEGDTSYLLYLGGADEDGLVDLLTRLEPVSEEAWLAALPDGRVPPGNGVALNVDPELLAEGSVAAVLADVPLPPDLDLENAYRIEGVWERDLVAASAFRSVACGWVQEWATATQDGDGSRSRAAWQALQSLTEEAVLREIAATSTVPEQVARYATEIGQDGAEPDQLQQEAEADLCAQPTATG